MDPITDSSPLGVYYPVVDKGVFQIMNYACLTVAVTRYLRRMEGGGVFSEGGMGMLRHKLAASDDHYRIHHSAAEF